MTAPFTLATEKFQGPLETLFNLIEERKMPVSEVSLAQVCDAYLAYVEKLPGLPLGETSQFILVASTLLLIKSRSLLPMLELSPEERDNVEELERRLARYALIRKSAKLLRREWGKRPLFLARRSPVRPVVFTPAEASVPILSGAIARLLSLLPKPEELAQAAVAPVLALEDVIKSLRTRLTSALRARFSELTRSRGKHEVIVYFLAMLELVRAGSISVTQERLFDDMTLEMEALGAPRYG